MIRCNKEHPLHRIVRCEGAKGHDDEHFNSFFLRRWDDSDERTTDGER